nr:uncharacterized protein LOC111857828 isoform X2 [Paramormyrops kingsleyae]
MGGGGRHTREVESIQQSLSSLYNCTCCQQEADWASMALLGVSVGKTHHAERQRVKSLVLTATMELGHKTAIGLMSHDSAGVCGSCCGLVHSEFRATNGDSLALNCTFQVPDESRVRVTWSHRNGSQAGRVLVSSSIRDNRRNVSEDRNPKELVYREVGHSWSRLTLRNTSFNNQGMYFCEVTVEIPHLEKCSGNGTKVIIGTFL